MGYNKDIDIIKNMKVIDSLKVELISDLANLHKLLISSENSTKDNLEDALSNIILDTYILAKRLGLDYEAIDGTMEENIRLKLIQDHKIERWYGDLSKLLDHIISR